MDLESRAEREIELIEQDETLTPEEMRRSIADVVEELRDALLEQRCGC